MNEKRDNIRGALIGFAIGDAMGATTEFMRKEDIVIQYGVLDKIIGGGWLHLPKGSVTDDTSMMLCVLRAMNKAGIFLESKRHSSIPLKNEVYFLNQCCQNFKDWFRLNPVDVGYQCKSVIFTSYVEKFADYKEWYGFADNPEALGNGGLMRCLPLALLPVSNYTLAIAQSDLTHKNMICEDAAISYCAAVNNALNGYGIIGAEYMQPSGHVTNTLNNALYWASISSSFYTAIVNAVNDGGDADTIAALTGGIAGAYFGYDAIPKEWIDSLDRGVLEELEKFAAKY